MTLIKVDFGKGEARSATPGKKASEKKIPRYQFHVALVFSDPLIWRRIEVPGQMTLEEFHTVLQLCMDWSGEHSHQFYVGKIFYSSVSATGMKGEYSEAEYDLQSLEEALKWCFTYMYDAGDGWELEITLEKTIDSISEWVCPLVLDGEWAAPPEKTGSVHLYTEWLHAFENPAKEKNKRLLEEAGLENFDPYHFDYESINARLKRHGWTKK
ncbi:MAG: plasmid pRiA4b ORF-3 family protein [Desulfopila sp.]|nr:plasmid pRiA4b ORF-3 family protein [Desulfopila sp.]